MLLPERRRAPRTEAAVSAANAELRKAVAALSVFAAFICLSTRASAGAKEEKQDESYRQSLKEQKQLEKRLEQVRKEIGDYEERLKKNPNDPRLHYNKGTFAYETEDYGTAEKELPLALNAPDLNLQQRAYYNLGNTCYRAGEQVPDDQARIAQWEKAVESYQSAAALDPQDADAKYNLEFVKKKLEELKKQQPKQEQKKNQNQDKQDQQKQDQKKDQEQQSESKKQQQKEESKPDSKQQEQSQ